MNWLLLALGGVIGTFGRYFLSGSVQNLLQKSFPYGTIFVNLLGTFLAGFIFSFLFSKNIVSPKASLFFLTGFCGAFTTFSTYLLESIQLFEQGSLLLGFLNLSLPIVLGLICCFLGIVLGRSCS